jgi:S-adenosylmethionine:tRNA ribosyltransferase-isomerase
VRTLESAVDSNGRLQAYKGFSNKFIYPPYAFGAVDALVTNFHLPRSSLLFLVAAFAGKDRLFATYREAVERQYRFYSYGDAMMVC